MTAGPGIWQHSNAGSSRRQGENVFQKGGEMWKLGSHMKTDFMSTTFWLTDFMSITFGWPWAKQDQVVTISVVMETNCLKLLNHDKGYHLACYLFWWCSLTPLYHSGKGSFSICPASKDDEECINIRAKHLDFERVRWLRFDHAPTTHSACTMTLIKYRDDIDFLMGFLWWLNGLIHIKLLFYLVSLNKSTWVF